MQTIVTERTNLIVEVGTLPVNTSNFLTRAESGLFYPSSNPSGFTSAIGDYVTPLQTGLLTGVFVNKDETGIFITNSQTGVFSSLYYPQSGLILLTIDQQSLGFSNGRLTLNNSGLAFTGESVGGTTITSGNLTEAISDILIINSGAGAVIGSGVSIQIKQASGTQNGYLYSGDWATFNNKQPAGNYITGVDLSSYVTGLVVRPSETGVFITGINLSNYVTLNQTGVFATTTSVDNLYYPRTNPSGFITGVNLSSYVTGLVVRPSETGIFATTTNVDNLYYPRSNPTGFITSAALSPYVTGNVVRPSETGIFATTSYVESSYIPKQPANANFRFKDGQLQLWDEGYFLANPAKPWAAIMSFSGILQVSAAIND